MAVRNRVLKIGIELEGAWTKDRTSTIRLLHRDASVTGFPSGYTVGECSSEPMNTIATAMQWMRDNYPSTVNETCGLHVHLSFNNLQYSRLIDESFNNLFLAAMQEFLDKNRGKPGFDLFASRLDGQNRYCYKIFRPEEQLWLMESMGSSRYSQLNYCYGRHGTLECRLFPCFPDIQDGKNAVQAFYDVCNLYLSRCKPEAPYVYEVKPTAADLPPPANNKMKYVLNHSV